MLSPAQARASSTVAFGVGVADHRHDRAAQHRPRVAPIRLHDAVVGTDRGQEHAQHLRVPQQCQVGAVELLDLLEQPRVVALMDVLDPRRGGATAPGGEQHRGRPALRLQAAGQLEADDGAHAVPEQRERGVIGRVQHPHQLVRDGPDGLREGLGAPVLASGVLHGEDIRPGRQCLRDGEEEARRTSGVRQAEQPRCARGRRMVAPYPRLRAGLVRHGPSLVPSVRWGRFRRCVPPTAWAARTGVRRRRSRHKRSASG